MDKFAPLEPIIIQHPSYSSIYTTKKSLAGQGYVQNMSQSYQMLSEVVIDAKVRLDISTVSVQARSAVSIPEIERPDHVSTADLAEELPGVFVQKSQYGGGSPNIRGFEASRVLLVVDGVRMNNAIYRSGHLQNILTVPPTLLEGMSVQLGPNSLYYGSDALGGVIHMKTYDPLPGPERSSQEVDIDFRTNGNVRNISYRGIVQNEKYASFTGIHLMESQSIKAGENRFHGYEGWSKLPVFINPYNSFDDSVYTNPDPNLQIGTGYSQVGIVKKFRFSRDKKLYGLNFQFSTSSDIPRFDRLNDIEFSGNPKFAVWNYGPQTRTLASFEVIESLDSSFFDRVRQQISHQFTEESRITRKYLSYDEERRTEQVQMLEYTLSGQKDYSNTFKLISGFQSWYNYVNSSAQLRSYDPSNTLNFQETSTSTRYPDGGSNYLTLAAFAVVEKYFNNASKLSAGLRYNHQFLSSQYEENFFNLPETKYFGSFGAPTASLGYTLGEGKRTSHHFTLSTGFHAPNLDDVAKVFEKANEVTVPNFDLKPEYVFNQEYRISLNGWREWLDFNLALYHTQIFQTIVKRPYSLNGEDSLDYDGERLPIVANTNSGQAKLFGFNLWTNLRVTKSLLVKASVSKTWGYETSGEPLSQVPPLFSSLTADYAYRDFTFTFSSQYNGNKPLSQYGPGSTDNPDEATVDGTPSFVIFNAFVSAPLNKDLFLRLGVENISDAHYKPFASGLAGPGRNFTVRIQASF